MTPANQDAITNDQLPDTWSVTEPERREIGWAELRQSLYAAVVCDALDSVGYRRQSPQVAWQRTITAQSADAPTGAVLVGRCHTTLWADMAHEDPDPYALELAAVDACRPNDVLIAAAGGSLRSGLWGELLTTAAMQQGCTGAVIDGGVRDVSKIRSMGFPIYARGCCLYDSLHRQRVIDRDVPVEIEGVVFSPGDLVFADEDGVVVVPQTVEQEVIARAWAKVHTENAVRDAIRNGSTAVAAYERFGVL